MCRVGRWVVEEGDEEREAEAAVVVVTAMSVAQTTARMEAAEACQMRHRARTRLGSSRRSTHRDNLRSSR